MRKINFRLEQLSEGNCIVDKLNLFFEKYGKNYKNILSVLKILFCSI